MTKTAARESDLDVVILGPYPPPLGGVSVHVARRLRLLRDQGVAAGVYNHFEQREPDPLVLGSLKRNPLRYFWVTLRCSSGALHYHHARPSTLFAVGAALALRRRPPRAVITLHGAHATQLLFRGPVRRSLSRGSLARFGEVVAVSEPIADEIRRHLPGTEPRIEPAFVPVGDEPGELDPDLRDFLAAPGVTALVSAYRVGTGPGTDTYGFDLTVDAFLSLAHDHPSLRLAIFAAHEPTDRQRKAYMATLERRLGEAGLGDRVRVRYGAALVPAFSFPVVYLRPTRSEGDSVSVREALEADVPVIASDTVARPEGVRLVPAEDVQALARAIAESLGP